MNVILLASIGACLAAGSFFIVTIFSLQRMLAEQRSAEDRLRESEQMLRAVVDNTTALITVKSPDGRYMMMNGRFQRRLGVLAVEAVGATDEELFPNQLSEVLTEGDGQALQAGQALELDQELDIGGERRSYMTVKFPLQDSGGRESALCTIMTDVTERKQLEEERNRFFELSLDIMVVSDFQGYGLLINPQFERTLGWTAEEAAQTPWIERVHPDDREATQADFRRLQAGQPTINFENRVLCKDGTYKRLSWRVMPATERGRAYAIAREVTEPSSNAIEADPDAGKVVTLHTADRKKT